MPRLITRLLCATGLTLAATVPAMAEAKIHFIIGVHPDVTYSAQKIGRVLSKYRAKMSNACGPIEFPSPSRAVLDSNLPSEVDGSDQDVLADYRATGTSIQIVPFISACGRGPVRGTIGGCARPRGPILVVPSFTEGYDAQIWAHEVGHAQRLNGSFPDYGGKSHSDVEGALMQAKASPNNWGMSTAECTTYYKAQTFAPTVDGEAIILEDPATDPAPAADDTPAEAFLKSRWLHGMDFEELEANREAIVAAAQAAFDTGTVEMWPNAVLVVGYAGGDAALGQISTALDIDKAETPEQAVFLNDAKINSGLALAYLAYQGNADAFGRLVPLLSPKSVLNSVPFADDGRDPEQLSKSVSIMATVGLSIVATRSDRAAELLDNQRQSQRAGAFDLGVKDSYFDLLDETSKSFRGRSLQDVLTDHDE